MKIIIIVTCLFLVTYSCVYDTAEDKRDIKFQNKSNGTVYCLRLETDSLKDYYLGLDDVAMNKLFKTPKDSSILIPDKPPSWDNFIKFSNGGRVRFFVISKDSVDKYGWRKVIEQNIYTKVYKLNIEDLNKIKWTITYTGKLNPSLP
jgi:hypothetical protein